MLQSVKKLRAWQWAMLAVVAGVLIYVPLSGNRSLMSVACIALMYIVLGESWNLLGGMAGIFSVCHALFFGLGVYGVTISVVKFETSLIVGILVGLLLCTAMAALVGFIGSKLSGLYFTMALIGLNQAIYSLSLQWSSMTGGTPGLTLPKRYYLNKEVLFLIILAMAIASIAFFQYVRQSRWGTNMVAVRENPNLALALGNNIFKWRVVATVISACMASLAGAYYAVYMMSNTPSIFSGTVSLKIIMVCVVGGVGHVWGPCLGVSLIILDEYVRGIMPSKFASFSVVVYALVLIAMALIKPDGIISFFKPRVKKAKVAAPPKADEGRAAG